MTCEELIKQIQFRALESFDDEHMRKLSDVLHLEIRNLRIEEIEEERHDLVVGDQNAGRGYMMFFVAKKIQGLSPRSLTCYKYVIDRFIRETNKPLDKITSDDIRVYLARRSGNITNVTLDNERRNLSSFFGFLTMEDYIAKNPIVKIGAIKQSRKVKPPFDELEIEHLRDACKTVRETAMVDLLLSTGMRVGELYLLNRRDIDFGTGRIIVFGKGSKERPVYMNAKANKHLRDYLDERKDDNEALIVGDQSPHGRLGLTSIETCMRELGKRAGVKDVHPHRFRRTAATMALNRGMPIEQVQKMLGHEQINTTLRYVTIAEEAVKLSHKRYM
jgi:site-specific recombinase XerD